MSDFDLVIRGGTIGTASAVFDADIGVTDGVIMAIGKDLPKGHAELDAKSKLVLPGGVDTHTHIEEPRGGPTANADTFITARVTSSGKPRARPSCWTRNSVMAPIPRMARPSAALGLAC